MTMPASAHKQKGAPKTVKTLNYFNGKVPDKSKRIVTMYGGAPKKKKVI